MFCANCGKELNDNEAFCPHCGAKQETHAEEKTESPRKNTTAEKDKHNLFAILGFVIALISLLLNFYGIVGIAAVIVSVIGLIKTSDFRKPNKNLAIAGIIIGGISVLYGFYTIL